ncbi:RHS repeat-associated core domain-containing protein, partial [Streptomyces sp. NPDC008343]|uniref:RHS repeat-associated core domain-containing protein n=1 Tax=Streptomyces sp. NPDC008343 TaxID=3364828 RepID=UPI0036ECB082
MAYNQANGLVDSVTQPDGSVTHQRYDHSGRTVEAWTSPKDKPDVRDEYVRTSYDPVTGNVSAQWFDNDEAGSKITYTYYPDGSLKERTDPGGKKTSFTYTDDNKTATVTDHTGAVTHYSYEAKSGRLSEAVQNRDGKELGKATYTYDTAGRLEKIDRGNGAQSTYTHNDANMPTAEKHTKPGGDVIAEHTYTYNHQRKLATDIATVDGRKTATSYTYNDQGNLTQSHTTEGDRPGEGPLAHKSEYTYDLATNLTQKKDTRIQDGQEKTTTTDYTPDKTSRTTHVTTDGQQNTQEYDDLGRLTRAADGTTHTYNTSGQLTETKTPDGTTVNHTYNPAGERLTQTTHTPDGQHNTLTYHPGTETDHNGATANYLTGTTRETRNLTHPDGTTETSYYLTNTHGDKTHTLDTNGNTTHTEYTDYGTPTTPTPHTGTLTENPYGYAGQYTTPTGHQPLGTRWYDPTNAAFTTPDTPTAGMLNPYTYATGDPINHTDPTGQSPANA